MNILFDLRARDISTEPDTNMMKLDDLKEDVKVAIEEAFEEMRFSLEQQHSRFRKGQGGLAFGLQRTLEQDKNICPGILLFQRNVKEIAKTM